MRFLVSPGGTLRGELRAASDKSISHRAVLLASLAEGTSEISNILAGEDVRSTIAAVQACGAQVREEKGRLAVSGGSLRSPQGDIDCGNSGTLMRLFCGIAAGWGLDAVLRGDESLNMRPMRRVAEPLSAMGADVRTSPSGKPPVRIRAAGGLRGMAHSIGVASAQVKSAILLAGLRAEGETSVIEPQATRDHTERMLEVFDVNVAREGLLSRVTGGAKLSPARFGVPADISSAAFFIAGAAISEGSEIALRETGVNPTRTGVIELLRRMGARIEVQNERQMGAEPVADIWVAGGGLRGIEIGAADVPSAIDEFPALLVAAAAAEGRTVLSGAGELRHKESDRIASVAAGLQAMGVECEETGDGIAIEGRGGRDAVFTGGEVDSNGDHRIAMAFAMAGLRAEKEIVVRDSDNVATSFPGFVKQATAAGLRIAAERD